MKTSNEKPVCSYLLGCGDEGVVPFCVRREKTLAGPRGFLMADGEPGGVASLSASGL